MSAGDIVFAELNKLTTALAQNRNRFQTVAANEAGFNLRRRIFNGGKATDGSSIGNYSTDPDYFSKKQFIQKGAFKPKGKRNFRGERIAQSQKLGRYSKKQKRYLGGKVEHKVYKTEVKSMYLDGGYKELRGIQGRRTDTVDLEYSGDLRRSIITGVNDEDVVLGVITEKSPKIIEGQEKRYKKEIFVVNDAELNAAEESFLREIDIVARAAF